MQKMRERNLMSEDKAPTCSSLPPAPPSPQALHWDRRPAVRGWRARAGRRDMGSRHPASLGRATASTRPGCSAGRTVSSLVPFGLIYPSWGASAKISLKTFKRKMWHSGHPAGQRKGREHGSLCTWLSHALTAPYFSLSRCHFCYQHIGVGGEKGDAQALAVH